jgi:hypothetical protein
MNTSTESNLKTRLTVFFFALITLTITGCGGGGGGGGGDGDGDGGDDPDPVLYNGNANATAITSSNAATHVNNIMGLRNFTGLANSSRITQSTPPEHISLIKLSHHLRDRMQTTFEKEPVLQKKILAQQVNDKEPCAQGGHTAISGAINNDGTGFLSVDFVNCQENSVTMHGKTDFQIDAFDMAYLLPTDATMSFPRLNIRGSTFNYDATGSMRIESVLYSNIEQMTINMVVKNNASGSTMKVDNWVMTLAYDDIFMPSTFSTTLTGRVFDSVEGYVDVTTPEPLHYSGVFIEYPDMAGQLLLSGAGDLKAKMIVASAQKVRIEADTTGDDTFDQYSVYHWIDIGGAAAPNESPDVSSIVIEPNNPFTTDNLTVNVAMVTDTDADPLSYSYLWRKNGTKITAQTSAILPADQHVKGDIIEVEVTVSDGQLASSNTDTVTIENTLPNIDAGAPVSLIFGDEPTLNGSALDADNDQLSYAWSVLSQPFSGNATFSDMNALSLVFSCSEQGSYSLQLEVDDGQGISTDMVTVTVEPMPLFNPYVAVDVPSYTEATTIGDVNNDGLNDVVLTTSSFSDPDNSARVFVLLQDASGNLSTPINYFAGLQPTHYQINSTAIADMNNDGMNDVIISYENGIGVMLQNVSGTLDPVTIYASNHSSFSNSIKVVVADFNGDGLNDAASIDWGTQSDDVDVYLQNNSGTLNSPVSYPAPHTGYDDLAYGDVNGDGLNDIIVMSGQSNSGHLSILLQQINNTFGAAVVYDLGKNDSANAVGVGDINGDNLDDVVLAYGGNRGSSYIALYYQNAGGTLDAPIHFPSYDIPGAVEIMDINSDGRKDIIVGHDGWSATSIYIQKPDGTLMGEQRYPFVYSSSNPHRMAVGDINADGQNDIVEANGTAGIAILYHQ